MGCRFSTAVSPEEPEDEAISKLHFSIERCIGQGGFGKVHAVIKNRGHDKGTWYAMKTLTKRVILERNHVAMVMKERNLLSRLHCPQLVNMHYAFQDQKNLYIIMDVCLGGDLHYQLSHSPSRCFSEEQAKFYVASIILCLDYMHSIGVLHRDVKPENLLLDSRGQLKVTDLGISMETVDGVCTSTSGTRPYMAPEIFMAGHRHGYVSDFYALGITTYQFLMGQRPYKPDTSNMKALVRMATFVPPEKYTEIRQIRRILIAAQERKAPSPEFRYSQKLAKYSSEARDFVTSCLICNPKYRLGSQGIQELMEHPWFSGLDWEAMRRQEIPALFLPDIRQPNCSISDGEAAAIMMNEEEDTSPEIPQPEQAKFTGFDYRTRVKDNISGRSERIIRHSTSLAQTHAYNMQQQQQQAQAQMQAAAAANGGAAMVVPGGLVANSTVYYGNDRERVRTINVGATSGILGSSGSSMMMSGPITVGGSMQIMPSQLQTINEPSPQAAGAFSVTPPTQQQQQQVGAMPRRSSAGGLNIPSSRSLAVSPSAGDSQQQQQGDVPSLLPPSSPAMRANAMPTIAVSPTAGAPFVTAGAATTSGSPLKSIPVSPPAGGGAGLVGSGSASASSSAFVGSPSSPVPAGAGGNVGGGQKMAYPAFIFAGDGASGGGGGDGGNMMLPPMLPPPSDNPSMQLQGPQQSLFAPDAGGGVAPMGSLDGASNSNSVGGGGGGALRGTGGGGYPSRRMLNNSSNNNNNNNNASAPPIDVFAPPAVLDGISSGAIGSNGNREASSGAPSSVGTTAYQQAELASASNSAGGRVNNNNNNNKSQQQSSYQQPQFASILGSPVVRQSPSASFSASAPPADSASGGAGAANPRSTLAAVAGVGMMAVNVGIPAALPAAQAGKWLAAATASNGGIGVGATGNGGAGQQQQGGLRSLSSSPLRGPSSGPRPSQPGGGMLPVFDDLPQPMMLLRPGSVEDEFIDGPPPQGWDSSSRGGLGGQQQQMMMPQGGVLIAGQQPMMPS